MILYTLEQRCDILRYYFENHSNVAEFVRKFCADFDIVILWKKWKKLASSSINQSVKSQNQCVHPRILLMWHNDILNSWTIRRHDSETLLWRHTKPNWFRSWSQLIIQCVFSSLSGPAIDLQKMPILTKKSYLQMKLNAKLCYLEHGKPARIHWKADAPKTSQCMVWILVQKHNWAILAKEKKSSFQMKLILI